MPVVAAAAVPNARMKLRRCITTSLLFAAVPGAAARNGTAPDQHRATPPTTSLRMRPAAARRALLRRLGAVRPPFKRCFQRVCNSSPMEVAPLGVSRVVRGACPHDCPDTCALRITVRGRPRRARPGRSRAPPHRRRAVHQGLALRRTHLPRRARAAPAEARRAEGRRPLRARRLGRGAGRHRAAAVGHRRARPRRPSCRTATPARWGWCRAKAWPRASSTSSARRCSTAPSARRAGGEALVATYGGKVGMHVEFFAESRLIVIWGSNSIACNLHFWRSRRRPSAPAPSWSASTRGAPRPPRSATSTRAAARHRRRAGAGRDARADRQRLARPRLHRAACQQSGWAQLRERALHWPPERAARCLRHRLPMQSAAWRAIWARRNRRPSASTTACSACAAAATRRA